ncbi:MAG TPA: monovalent cation/H(+) antiporter subunit G [Ktedonobacterales bacterium]|nr:monovalent cation/H(+) antiporter subunit G [Ktedonobacterales bacterium]
MTWQTIFADVLLALGVGIELLSCLGLLVMNNVFDRLHYVGPAATLGPIAIAGAVLLEEGISTAGLKAILIAVVLVGVGPIVTHATARAARVRQFGQWQAQPGEHIEEC